MFLGVLSTFPTSAEANLGSGKYNLGPLLATARFLPQWESFLFGVFQHLTSVGGDPGVARSLAHEGDRANQYDLQRAMVDDCSGSLAGGLGAQRKDQHDS